MSSKGFFVCLFECSKKILLSVFQNEQSQPGDPCHRPAVVPATCTCKMNDLKLPPFAPNLLPLGHRVHSELIGVGTLS